MSRLDGKVAIITGGARGMGAVEAAQFVEAGATVVITDVLDEQGARTAERIGGSCVFHHHDVTSPAEWSRLVEQVLSEYGRIDVLVNNAGIAGGGGFLMETTIDEWNSTVAVNQTGVFLGMQAVVPAMDRNPGGSIVNISSVAGMKSLSSAHVYSATKWAVRGMTKSAAVELGPKGIRVNSVHPGLIETDMISNFEDHQLDALLSRVPLGRLGAPPEVGRLVRFLASDDAAYCTGQEFVIDGGISS